MIFLFFILLIEGTVMSISGEVRERYIAVEELLSETLISDS